MDRISLCIKLLLLVLTAVVGYAEAAAGYRPNSSLPVNVWTNANDKWFLYPEQDQSSDYFLPEIMTRPSFGIAVSGGGFRAVTLALGYVRGLYMLNLTQQARYLSSNSGGSWFNSAFSYQKTVSVEEFIGPFVPPQNLTKDALKATGKGEQGAFANTISNAVIKANAAAVAVKDVVVQSDKGPGAWSISIGNAFLAPYELNSDTSTFSATGTKGPIHQGLQKLDAKVYYYQGAADTQTAGNISRPYPIILGSLYNEISKNMTLFYPLEMTPEYIGIPPVFPNEQPNKTVGGGMVDTFGFNSYPPDEPPKVPAALKATLGKVPPNYGVLPKTAKGLRHLLQATSTAAAAAPAAPAATPPAAAAVAAPAATSSGPTATNGAAGPTAPGAQGSQTSTGAGAAAGVPAAALANNRLLPLSTEVNSSFLMPLKVAAGISSSFLAQGVMPVNSEALKELTGTEELQYWNKVNFEGMKQTFADGGGTDNLAVTPLLRRKVRYIVACIAASEYLGKDTKLEDWAFGQWDIAALFGAVPLKHKGMKKGLVNGMPPEVFNKVTQVFPTSAFNAMFNGFKKSIAAGGPAYHLAEYTVMNNPYQAVTGGYKVKVLWVVNAVELNWEKQLPSEVRDALNGSRKKKGGLFEKDSNASKEAEADDAKASWGTKELKRYPYISTYDADYTPELTGMLSQQATWQMLELQPQLKQMLSGSGVQVGAASNVGKKTQDKNVGAPSKTLKSSAGAAAPGVWNTLMACIVVGLLAPFVLMA